MEQPSPAARRLSFRKLLEEGRTLVVPGCHDALSAMILADAGFEVSYIGSYATAAADLGLPDVGALGLDDLVGRARRIVDAVAVPVIADAEGGFFEPANIWRTVRAFEQAGVAGIHIEDHAGGKHTELPQSVVPLDEMLARITAAREAREDCNFQIIARTDAVWAASDPAEALRRIRAFHEAGADMVFPTGATPQMLSAFRAEVPARYVVVEGPGHPKFSGHQTAASLVLFYGFSLLAAANGLSRAVERFRADPAADMRDFLEHVRTFEGRLDYAGFTARARRYSMASGDA